MEGAGTGPAYRKVVLIGITGGTGRCGGQRHVRMRRVASGF